MDNFIYALASVSLVSLISLVGAGIILLKREASHGALLVLVGFAAGAMLGAAFFDLLPEAIEEAGIGIMPFVFLGIMLFLFIESFLHWHHCANGGCEVHDKKSIGYMNLLCDGVHNFLDGVIIASAYLVSLPAGIVATIAIIAHEIPQEMGDFAVLLHAGFSNRKALFYNFLSATASIAGAVLGFFFLSEFEHLIPYATAIAAGGFIYIATADLFPEISRHHDARHMAVQLLSVLVGSGIVFALLQIISEGH